jgi:hypothetical protein
MVRAGKVVGLAQQPIGVIRPHRAILRLQPTVDNQAAPRLKQV